MQGPRRYFSEMWNWAEILMILLFGLTFLFWVLAALDVAINDEEHIGKLYLTNQILFDADIFLKLILSNQVRDLSRMYIVLKR